MTTLRLLAPAALSALAVAAARAVAQYQITSDSVATYSLTWQETDAAGNPVSNPDGILEPGEHALLRLTVSFTNQNTIGSFSPPIQGFGSGTIRGFGAGFVDLNGTGDAHGTWDVNRDDGFGVNPSWFQVVGGDPDGMAVNGGANLINIEFLQVPVNPAGILTTNPVVDIWTGLWTPASYAPRTVTFQSAPGSASGGFAAALLFRTGPTTLASAIVAPSNVNLGSVDIPIVPAPASLLALAPLVLRRRRRTASLQGAAT